MTKDHFASLARTVYGSRGWQVEVAKANGVHRSTAHRWMNGELTIPLDAITRLKEAAADKAARLEAALAA